MTSSSKIVKTSIKLMEMESANQPQKAEIDRRDFLQKSIYLVGGTVGAAWLLNACGKSNPSPSASAPTVNFTIDISTSQYNSLQTNGNYLYTNNLIVARDNSGKFIALYDVCPHAGCNITFNGTNQFPCPCHGSLFDENGNVIQGPATTGVKKYTCTLVGTKLTVAG
jgi:cytochrome b6-f complex iron-sulfur subunit